MSNFKYTQVDCPCGETIEVNLDFFDVGNCGWWIFCDNCCSNSGAWKQTFAQALANWNKTNDQ